MSATPAGGPEPDAAEGDVPEAQKRSTWQRFLDQKTTPQRLLIALAAIATAVVAIATLFVTVAGWLAKDESLAIEQPSGMEEVLVASSFTGKVIESGTVEGDTFVRYLVSVAGKGPVSLNLTVRAPKNATAITTHLPLWYLCDPGAVVGDGVCKKVRLEVPSDAAPAETKPLGWRFRGDYRVTIRTGVDYGQDLDISFDDINA